MSIEPWRTYLEVCRLGSFSAAAAELGYTQSAVSRQVAALERLAGAPLLQRHARGVAPTPAGEAFRHHARMVVTEAMRAVRAARDADAGADAVVVGATPSTAAGIVPVALRAAQDQGQLVWSLVTGLSPALEEMVLAGEVDVAVVTDAPPGLRRERRVRRQLLGTDAMAVVVPSGHPAAASDCPLPLACLAEEAWVEDNDGSEVLLRTAAARKGFEPRIELRAADLSGKIALVAAGHGVAMVPGALRPALRRDVVMLPLADAPTRGIYASMSATSPARARVRDLVAALEAALEPGPGAAAPDGRQAVRSPGG